MATTGPGRALADGGLVIDMSLMRRVSVDAQSQIASISGGARAADVVAATEPHGLVPATGNFGDVGIVGLTLGGGYGPLNGVAGLALDNLIDLEVVLEDGRAIVVDADRDPDLFWALRGGGGNFGVVTGMRVRLHPVPSVTGGIIMFPWHHARDVISAYAALEPTMPDELTVALGVIAGPAGGSVVYLAPAWSGNPDAATTWIDRLSSLGRPMLAQVAAMPYSALLHLLDPYVVWGRHHEKRTRTLRTLNAGAIDVLFDAGASRTSAFSGIAIHHFHGAAARVPVQATAFGIRTPHLVVEVMAAWDPLADGTTHRAWAEQVYADLAAHSVEGGYTNLIGPDQAAQADAANARRLLEVKRRYDPHNVFSATHLPSADRSL